MHDDRITRQEVGDMVTAGGQRTNFENLRVVLVATRNPLNIGAAARAMSNFGALHLRVVNPFDPSFREAKSAVGAAELLQHAELFSSVPEAVADCSLVVGTTAARDREVQQPLHRLEVAAPLLRDGLRGERWRSFLDRRSAVSRKKTWIIAIGSCTFPRVRNTSP